MNNNVKKKSIFAKCVVAVLTAAFILTAMPECVSVTWAAKTEEKKQDTEKRVNTYEPMNRETYRKGTYHVALDGTGDFTNISSAVVSVPSGSTLIIHEGIYNEALSILGKVINMRGVSKEKCIIQYDTANYAFVPLNISGGTYENLTIRGYHKSDKLAAFQGYAIHIDHDSLAGQAVNFNNCNIVSENAFCVGIGLRRGARIAFRGCNFLAKKQGAILFHDSQTPTLAGKAYLSLENCNINNSAPELLIAQCLSPASTTELTLRNNNVSGIGDGGCLAYGSYAGDGKGWMGAHNVFLTKNSTGNNIMSFNYADLAKYQDSLSIQARANAAKLEASNYYSNVSPSGKYYTVTTEDGKEINIPVENIDNYSVHDTGKANESNNGVNALPSQSKYGANEISPSGKYYTITTEDGIEINVPVENID